MPPYAPMTRVSTLKAAVARTFGNAAEAYHTTADIQRDVAGRLARRIGVLPLPGNARGLEIGCGTGFLHQALAQDIGGTWLLSDLSETMVRRARITLGGSSARFIVMDGEQPSCKPGSFDLICSSLAFQWFEDLPGALKRLCALLAPGGVLAFATLARDSFPEWRGAHQDLGLAAALRDYPTLRELGDMTPARWHMTLTEERLVRAYPNAHVFLQHWKKIGTHLPDARRRPLTPGAMRRLLRKFSGGIDVSYHVAYGVLRKEGPSPLPLAQEGARVISGSGRIQSPG